LQPDWNRSGTLAALLLCLALAAGAEEPAAGAAPPPPTVGLDRLLKLPSDVEVSRDQIGSSTRTQWRARFASARAEQQAAQAALDATQKKLGTAAAETDAWQIAAPGAGAAAAASEAPVDFALKADMRRQRADLKRSEKVLRELTIEADLAGVPADWRE
jgi:hypothetical protein